MYKKIIKEYYTPSDALVLHSSLFIRLMEYIKETPAITDEQIHKLAEVAAAWNEKYDILNMDAYQSLISTKLPY
jgi:lipase chaperone LimK